MALQLREPVRERREAAGSMGSLPASTPLTWAEGMRSVLFGGWLIFGLFIDGWAHNHQKPETILTPWHAILYSGFLAAAWHAILVVRKRHHEGGRALLESPPGHALVLVGLVIFGFGATGDLAWHTIFGVEVSLAALLSPTHLVMFCGAMLVLTGPFRALWADADQWTPSFKAFLPALLSLTLATALASFFFQYVTPFRRDNYGTWVTAFTSFVTRFSGAASGYAQNLQVVGLAAIVITNVIYIAPLLLVVRRWRPPFGSATLLLTTVTVLVGGIDAFNRPAPLLAAVPAGLVADLLIRRFRPSAARPWAAHAMATATSLVLWSTFFAIYELTYGVGWKPELWAGSIVVATIAAAGLSAMVFPPALPVPVPQPAEV